MSTGSSTQYDMARCRTGQQVLWSIYKLLKIDEESKTAMTNISTLSFTMDNVVRDHLLCYSFKR